MRVLVAAASKHGATQQIGEAIARHLGFAGFETDLSEPADVEDLEPFSAVVLGSAIYAGRWMSEAREFVDRFASELQALPVWLFSSGPLGDPAKPEGDPPDATTIVERLGPRGHRVFAGRLRREDLNLAERAVVRGVKAPHGDFRDWQAIANWSKEIADAILEDLRT